jgi:methylenetetrahydrofolate reductase (NADPH)
MDMSAPKPVSRLDEILRSGHFTFTGEVVPPVSGDPQHLLAKATPFKGVADAVNVTDGAGARSHMCSLASAAILLQAGIEPVLQMTCRDRNRIGLQSDLMGALALGLRNVLILTGDKPSAGDQPDTKPVFDLDSRALQQTAKMIGEGQLPTGTKVTGASPFLIGAAEAPIDPPADWQPKGLLAKIAGGARFAQTQFCMDAGIVRRYMARLIDAGLPKGFGVLIGVTPLRTSKSGTWMRNNLFGTIISDEIIARMEKASDAAAEGRRICIEYIEELATIPGVGGVHVMAPGNEAAAPEVINEARSRLPKR